MAHPDVFARVERAYERGLAWRALLAAWPAVLVACAALALSRPPVVALALVAAAVVFLYLGRGFGRGVYTGLIVGIVPFAVPALERVAHGCSSSSCAPFCLFACGVGGLVAGVSAGLLARGDVRRMAASMVCAGLVGALGCAALGAFAVVGMAAALASGAAVPTLWLRRA